MLCYEIVVNMKLYLSVITGNKKLRCEMIICKIMGILYHIRECDKKWSITEVIS